MDHHDHSSHGGSHGDQMCSMNMLFTWDTNNLCIVFPSWRISSTASLIFSLLAVVVLTAGYEAVRELSRTYESRGSIALTEAPSDYHDREDDEDREERERERSLFHSSVGRALRNMGVGGNARKSKMIKALLYATQVFYSFFIMLLFMTYNGWVMLAVAVGAFVGFMAFGSGSATKTVACH